MAVQRGSYWQEHCLSGLPSNKPDLIFLRVEVCPSKRSNIGQPLSGIEPEFDQTLPFRIGHRQKILDFLNAKWPATALIFSLNRFYEFRWILENVAVPARCSKDHFNASQIKVGRDRRYLCGQRITEARNMRGPDLGRFRRLWTSLNSRGSIRCFESRPVQSPVSGAVQMAPQSTVSE
jgi:hypothetical protein